MKNLSHFQKLAAVFMMFISGMILCRILYSGSFHYISLLWNLFLAWIPFKISLYLTRQQNSHRKWPAALLLAAWLLFFPNALYLVTDLIHLEGKTELPVLYDAILLFTSAVTGLLFAFASLYKVEIYLKSQISNAAVNQLMVLCLFAGSFGVYLGRYLRWNSWDIITNPVSLAKEIMVRLIFPVEYYRAWAVTILFTCVFSLFYFAIKRFTVHGARLQQAVMANDGGDRLPGF